MKHNVLRLLLTCMSLLPVVLCAQVPQNPVNVQSPNATSLGLFGEVPVSAFTGLPNIGVPLCELKSKTIDLPISLSYHASGFRPDQHPGWVGAGWNLSAGGTISRVVKDMPDDYNNGTWMLPNVPNRQTFAETGYYWNGAFVNTWITANGDSWNSTAGIRNLTRSAMVLTDSEPDEFSFNFLGYSGKFFRDIDGTWKAKCDKPVRIEINTGAGVGGFLAVPFAANGTANEFGVNGQPHGYSPSFAGFEITGEDGVKYEFGGNTDAIEYNIGFFAQHREEWVASAWHLTKITPISGSPIELTYEAGDYVSQMSISVDYSNNCSKVYTNGIYIVSVGGVCNSSSSYSNLLYFNYQGKLIRPSYLRLIRHLRTEIHFYRSPTNELYYPEIVYQRKRNDCGGSIPDMPYQARLAGQSIIGTDSLAPMAGPGDPGGGGGGGGGGGCSTVSNCFFFLDEAAIGYPCCINPNQRLIWNKLDQIKVFEDGQLMRRIDLTYSNDATKRLTLQAVAEYGSDQATTKKPYTFSYYPYSYNGTSAEPPYLAHRTDHWGFFNDREAVLPPIVPFPPPPANPFTGNYCPPSPDFGNYYAYREPAAASNTAVHLSGMLSRITYPTGGKTEFEYEQHSYSKNLNTERDNVMPLVSDQPAGGVRVKKISSYDDPGAKVIKEYQYSGVNGMSSGVLGGMTLYWFANYTRSSPQGSNSTVSQDVFSSQGVLPACSNSRGSHIGYSRVTELNSDGGKRISEFTNFSPGFFDEPGVNLQTTRTPYEPYSDNDETRGRLQLETFVNAAGQTVKTRRITYTKVARSGRDFVQAVKGKIVNFCSALALPVHNVEEGTAYKLYTYSYLPSQEVEVTYDLNGANPVSITKNYTYNSNKLLASTSTVDSKGAKAETLYTYAYELYYGGPNPDNRTHPDQVRMIRGMTLMESRNMLAYPVEIISKNNGFITSAQAVGYREFGNRVLPFRVSTMNALRPVLPSNYIPVTLRFQSGIIPSFRTDPKLTLKLTYTDYDGTGNVIGLIRAGDSKTSYQYGYNQLLPTAATNNASRTAVSPSEITLGNEASHLSFETGANSQGTNINEDYWNMNGGTQGNSVVPTPHTGRFAYYVGPPAPNQPFNYGPGKTFAPERQQLRYKLSAWVKTSSTFPANGGALVIGANRADGTQLACGDCYKPIYFNSTQNEWQYVEAVLDLDAVHTAVGVPAASERFRLTTYCMSANRGSFLIDDLRFQPLESSMLTYTYEPNSQQATSISDPRSVPTTFEYDPLQRLKLVRDLQGNITSQTKYNYRP